MTPENPLPSPEDGHRKGSGNDRYFLRLWVVVTVFWTAATLIRVDRVWVPIEGWPSVINGPWLWLELGLPPLMFGVVAAAASLLARNERNLRVVPPWRRRRS